MEIEATKSRSIQNRFRQQQAIGDDDGGIRIELGKAFLLNRFLERRRPCTAAISAMGVASAARPRPFGRGGCV